MRVPEAIEVFRHPFDRPFWGSSPNSEVWFAGSPTLLKPTASRAASSFPAGRIHMYWRACERQAVIRTVIVTHHSVRSVQNNSRAGVAGDRRGQCLRRRSAPTAKPKPARLSAGRCLHHGAEQLREIRAGERGILDGPAIDGYMVLTRLAGQLHASRAATS